MWSCDIIFQKDIIVYVRLTDEDAGADEAGEEEREPGADE